MLNTTASASSQPSSSHIVALDGLRGFAVIMVLLTHLTPYARQGNRALEWGYKVIQSGIYGVDLFFVLSGFLITAILLKTRDSPTRWRDFYVRRALRIFPLYYFVLFLIFGVGHFFHSDSVSYENLASHQAWHWLYATNLFTALEGTYKVNNSGFFNLTHFWSLCVEEHFYLIWPFLVFWLGARGRRLLLWCCVGAILLSNGLRVLALALEANRYWWGVTPLRLDGLAVGCLLALCWSDSERRALLQRLAPWAVGAGLVFYLMVMALFKGFWGIVVDSIGYTVVALFFGALLTLCLTPETLGERVFSWPILRFFGKYSYAIYIFHPFVALVVRYYLPASAVLAKIHPVPLAQLLYVGLSVVPTVLLALLSWNLLEKHFLKLKEVWAPRPILQSAPNVTSVS